MEIQGSRRLTGPNRWTDGPAACVQVQLDAEDKTIGASQMLESWHQHIKLAAQKLGWGKVETFQASEEHSIMLAFYGPLDGLYTACELAEWAVKVVHANREMLRTNGSIAADFPEDAASTYQKMYDEERNPHLLAFQKQAEEHQVPMLWDDDHVSLGFGRHAQVWPAQDIPAPKALQALPWGEYQRIPCAFITGTNGKTTTSRLLTRIAVKAQKSVGSTSTDGLCINEEIVDKGDWTGPGGARQILRDQRIDLAVLETARGGMLRRGLATDLADAAVVTNVSDDHLGEWGIHTVEQMAEVKLLIRHGIRPGGTLFLYADCPELVSAFGTLYQNALQARPEEPFPYKVAWYTLSNAPEKIQEALPFGKVVAWQAAGLLHFHPGLLSQLPEKSDKNISVKALPVTLNGLASYNIANAMAAGLLALSMGLSFSAIREGLMSFQPSTKDSPGRTNLFHKDGLKILIDFGHNPDGVKAIAHMASELQPKRTLVLLGQAGDRIDEAIAGLATSSLLCKPEQIVLKKMTPYLRGRAEGEVVRILEQTFLDAGVPASQIVSLESEAEAITWSLSWGCPGDLLLLFVQADFPAAVQQVEAFGATEGWPR